MEIVKPNTTIDFVGKRKPMAVLSTVVVSLSLVFVLLGSAIEGFPFAPKYGVDFIFFDGEELIYERGDKYFLGSEYFAEWYRDTPPKSFRYVCGVLVDMIADKKLAIYIEKNSLNMAPNVTRSVWATARRMGVKEFVAEPRYEVRDDHLALNEIAKIPTCDIIDFDYPYWHTTRDTASACSAASLSKVGRVLLQWLTEVPINPPVSSP